MISDHHGHHSLDLRSPWENKEGHSAGPWDRGQEALKISYQHYISKCGSEAHFAPHRSFLKSFEWEIMVKTME